MALYKYQDTKEETMSRKHWVYKVEKNGWVGYTKKSLRQSFNAMIQGTSADMMRMAMVKTYNEAKKYPQYEIKIVGTIHDEQIVICNEKYAKESAQLVKRCMETCVSFSVPIVSDTEIVENYGEAK
jgi:DNA polymerase-1